MAYAHAKTDRRRIRRGMSLVEILVVLVILVIGIFAITRLFPQGFANLNFTAARTQATATAKLFEDYLAKNRENLPDAIVAVDRATGLLRTDLSPAELYHPNPYTDNPINGYAGTPPEDPRYSGLNVARRVIGEQFKIAPPTVAYGPNAETVSLYRPLFGPIYAAAPMGVASLGVAAYSGTPMERVVGQNPLSRENEEEILTLGVQGYGVDYDQGLLYFVPAPYDRLFKIEFSYRTGPGTASQTVPNNSIFIPADPNALPNPDPVTGAISIVKFDLRQADGGTGSAQPGFLPLPGGAVLDPGSDHLFRRFNQIAVNTPFSNDPYEFKVYDTILGLLGFNPISASIPLPHQRGRGLTARIDYDVDDWEIVRQDEVVPLEQLAQTTGGGNGYYALKLLDGGIKRYLDVEDTINFIGAGGGGVDTTFEYQGLIRNYPAGGGAGQRPGTPGVDLVIVDLQTGYTIDSRTLQKEGNSSNGFIDYDTGVVHLRYDPGNAPMWSPPNGLTGSAVHLAPAGRNVRLFYRTINDMGVAAVKPYTRYLLQPALNALQSGQYYAGYGAGYLLFPPTDAEKTVAVDYTWQDVAGRMHVETGELHRIQRPDSPPPVSVVAPVVGCGGAGGFDPGRHWWVRLSHAEVDSCKSSVGDPNADLDVQPGTLKILGVRGVSVHTRVTWRDGSRRRHLERATLLTRERSR